MKSIVIGLLIVAIVAVHAFLLHPPGGWREWWRRRPRWNEFKDDIRPRRYKSDTCAVSVGVDDDHNPYAAGWVARGNGEPREHPCYRSEFDVELWLDGYDDSDYAIRERARDAIRDLDNENR